SIQAVVSDRPLLVEARLVGPERRESGRNTAHVSGVNLQVVHVLKGELAAKSINVVDEMCYASLYTEVMQIGHTYVLPLDEPIEGRYMLAMCAHSGLELIDGKLYSFEPTFDGG